MSSYLSIEPLTVSGCLMALLCGFLIGFERQWRGKPAGIRTSILVCMGAYTFIAIANHFQVDNDGGMRVLGQLVTGVGFLGAGMMLSKEGIVHGVTSASVIWVLAAIGCLIGFNNYMAAIAMTILTLFVLVGITFLERTFKKLRTGVHKRVNEESDNGE